MHINKLHSIKEVSELTSIKPSMIYKLIREGKFPEPIKINSSSRWSSRAIAEWVNKLDRQEI